MTTELACHRQALIGDVPLADVEDPSAPEGVRLRKMALVALFLVATFNHIDRTILQILQIPVKADLGLSDSQLGALTGIAFALFYATISLPLARLADRYNRRWIIVTSLTLWSAMTAICGLAAGFWSLAFFRVGVAIGEAGSIPATMSLIADYYPFAKRARAIAVWGTALPIGLVIGTVAIGALGSKLGWRVAFGTVGGAGVLLAPTVFALLTEPRRGRYDTAAAGTMRQMPLAPSLAALWRNRLYRYLVIASTLHVFTSMALANWNVSFFVRSHGFSLFSVSVFMAIHSGLATTIGIYGSGWMVERLAKRDRRWRLWIIAVALAATTPLALIQCLVPSTPVAVAAALLTGMMMYGYYAPFLAALQSAVPTTTRAFGVAVQQLVINLLGVGLGPLAVGILSDHLTPQFGGNGLRYALAMAAFPSMLGAMVMLYSVRFYLDDAPRPTPAV